MSVCPEKSLYCVLQTARLLVYSTQDKSRLLGSCSLPVELMDTPQARQVRFCSGGVGSNSGLGNDNNTICPVVLVLDARGQDIYMFPVVISTNVNVKERAVVVLGGRVPSLSARPNYSNDRRKQGQGKGAQKGIPKCLFLLPMRSESRPSGPNPSPGGSSVQCPLHLVFSDGYIASVDISAPVPLSEGDAEALAHLSKSEENALSAQNNGGSSVDADIGDIGFAKGVEKLIVRCTHGNSSGTNNTNNTNNVVSSSSSRSGADSSAGCVARVQAVDMINYHDTSLVFIAGQLSSADSGSGTGGSSGQLTMGVQVLRYSHRGSHSDNGSKGGGGMKGVLVVEDLGTCGMPGGGSVLDLSIACLPPLMSSLSSAQTRAGAGAGVGLSNNQEKGEDASGGSCVCVALRSGGQRASVVQLIQLDNGDILQPLSQELDLSLYAPNSGNTDFSLHLQFLSEALIASASRVDVITYTACLASISAGGQISLFSFTLSLNNKNNISLSHTSSGNSGGYSSLHSASVSLLPLEGAPSQPSLGPCQVSVSRENGINSYSCISSVPGSIAEEESESGCRKRSLFCARAVDECTSQIFVMTPLERSAVLRNTVQVSLSL